MQLQALEVISVNIWQIIIALLNLVVMFFILKRFLFKPVKNILAQRRNEVDKIYDEAQKNREEAVGMKQTFEANLAHAREEADSIVHNATQTAQHKSEIMLQEASMTAARIKQKAQEEVLTEKAQMLQDVRSEIAGIAVEIASEVMGREIKKEDHEAFVNDFIKNVGDAQ